MQRTSFRFSKAPRVGAIGIGTIKSSEIGLEAKKDARQ